LQDGKKPSCKTQGRRSYFNMAHMANALRLGSESDLADMRALLEASRLPLAGIEQHVTSALVARENGKLVGCAAVEIYGSAGLLRSVAVAEERRGEGLGQQLTEAALELARASGVRDIYLLTTTASHFFPRFGFTAIPRAELDPALSPSEELRGACPANALAMRAQLSTSSPPSQRSSSPPPAPPG
jgi:amino-acid N-acetyltransferase